MTKTNARDSAYPVMPPKAGGIDGSCPGYPYPQTGLTKREAFALACVSGIFQSFTGTGWANPNDYQLRCVAKASVRMADMLIAELNGESDETA